jgi:hypothetical protein
MDKDMSHTNIANSKSMHPFIKSYNPTNIDVFLKDDTAVSAKHVVVSRK